MSIKKLALFDASQITGNLHNHNRRPSGGTTRFGSENGLRARGAVSLPRPTPEVNPAMEWFRKYPRTVDVSTSDGIIRGSLVRDREHQGFVGIFK